MTTTYTEITTNLPTSYIDANNLKECLDGFYLGTLDDVNPYMDRLYRRAIHLHPTNTLWGQLDGDLLLECINKLSSCLQASIEYYFTNSLESEKILEHHYYQATTLESYDSWLGINFIEALNLLSTELIKVL